MEEAPAAGASNQPNVSPLEEANPPKRSRNKQDRLNIQKEKHPILPPCTDKCRRLCSKLITENERIRIHEEFWKMHHDIQKQWLLSRVHKMPVQRRRSSSTPVNSHRSCSLEYTLLNISGDTIKVCQSFFLRTLGYSSNRIIVELLRN